MPRKPRPSDKIKIRNYMFFEKDIHDTITKWAVLRGVTRTEIVKEALKEYIERHKKEYEGRDSSSGQDYTG